MTLRVRVEDLDGGEAETYAFLRSPVRVGRGALNDLRLDRPYVSTWHGLIQFDGDGIRFVDLGSTNGTFLDGARLERNAPAAITTGRELTVGRLRLVLTRGATQERRAPAEPVTHFALRVARDVPPADPPAMDVHAAAAAAVLGTARPAQPQGGPGIVAAPERDAAWPSPPTAPPPASAAPPPIGARPSMVASPSFAGLPAAAAPPPSSVGSLSFPAMPAAAARPPSSLAPPSSAAPPPSNVGSLSFPAVPAAAARPPSSVAPPSSAAPPPSSAGSLSFPALPAVAAPPPSSVAPPASSSGPPDPEVEGVLKDASWQLGVLHDACQRASEDFRVAFEQTMTSLGEEQRRRARALAAERYPHAFAGAPQAAAPPVAAAPAAVAPAAPFSVAEPSLSFPALPAAPGRGVAPAPVPVAALRDDALRLVRAFAEAYISGEAAPTTPDALERFLGALAEALETSARGYLELRSGYEQFGREMGIRVPSSDGTLGRISDVRQLVGWLLQPGDGESRPRQLAGAFADLMIHQVALLNGVQAGARELIDELSPEAVEKLTERGGGLGLKALREAALWRTFVERHQELAAEESAVTSVLFGQAFARAYTAVAGRRSPTGDQNRASVTSSRKTGPRDQEKP